MSNCCWEWNRTKKRALDTYASLLSFFPQRQLMSSRLGRRPVYQLIITSRCFSIFYVHLFYFYNHSSGMEIDQRIFVYCFAFIIQHRIRNRDNELFFSFIRFIPTVNFLMNSLAHTDSDYFFLKYPWYEAMLVPRTCGSQKQQIHTQFGSFQF